jgi:hypothetical protein
MAPPAGSKHDPECVLNKWTQDFLVPTPFWVDIVEDAIP